MRKVACAGLGMLVLAALFLSAQTASAADRADKRQQEMQSLQEQFTWWPTDAKPGPVKDEERGGYWWWPETPGEKRPWGNRGYVYVYKLIFDYKEEELPPPQPQELRPSLLIKRIIKNVKIYFDLDSSTLRDDAASVLTNAVRTLERYPETDILITGNCDIRGSEQYNMQLGKNRAAVVKSFILDHGIDPERVRIVSRGKLDAVSPITDLEGMQKDRNAQFMIAEVEEVMIPYTGAGQPEVPAGAEQVDDGTFVVEQEMNVETAVQVSTKEYVVQKNDSLWKIAERECGAGHRWKYIYELNKDTIKDPNKLVPGTKIVIPVE